MRRRQSERQSRIKVQDAQARRDRRAALRSLKKLAQSPQFRARIEMEEAERDERLDEQWRELARETSSAPVERLQPASRPRHRPPTEIPFWSDAMTMLETKLRRPYPAITKTQVLVVRDWLRDEREVEIIEPNSERARSARADSNNSKLVILSLRQVQRKIDEWFALRRRQESE